MTVNVAGYELEYRLGAGANATVWRARQVAALGRPVALKRMRAAGEEHAARIQAEAQALVALDHPNIVRVFEVVPDGAGVAIAMQFASGGSLAERLERCLVLPAPDAVNIATCIADALSSAHRRGILHLDVKPANVLFTSDGDVLLGDFDATRRTDGGDTAGPSAGTPGFAAPEVVAGDMPDVRADVYALGRLLGTMTGWSMPPGLASVVAAATAVDRDDRYPDVGALTTALRAATLDGESIEVDRRAEPPSPSSAGVRIDTVVFGPRPPGPAPATKSRTPGRRLIVVGGAAALAAALAGIAYNVLLPSERITAPRAASPAHACAVAAVPTIPAGSDLLEADVDGDGCADPVVRTDNVLERNGVRFALGDDGDLALLGDWDCDGVATPAVWRRSARRAYLFDAWAGPDEPLPAAGQIAAGAPPNPTC